MLLSSYTLHLYSSFFIINLSSSCIFFAFSYSSLIVLSTKCVFWKWFRIVSRDIIDRKHLTFEFRWNKRTIWNNRTRFSHSNITLVNMKKKRIFKSCFLFSTYLQVSVTIRKITEALKFISAEKLTSSRSREQQLFELWTIARKV